MPRLSLDSGRFQRRSIEFLAKWERGAFRRPHVPSRAERRLRDDGQRRRWRLRLRFALRLPEIRFCGVRASPACDMPMFFTHRSGAAAFSRPDMPHTLRSPPGEIPKSCPRRHLRRLAPCGAAGTFWKPCAPGLPCGLRRTHPCAYCSCCLRISRHCAAFYGDAGTRLRYRHTGAAAP